MYDIQTRSWTGIQTNTTLIQPSEIAFSNKKGPAIPQEPGFSFAFPKDKQMMLKKIFLDGCVGSGIFTAEEAAKSLKKPRPTSFDFSQGPKPLPFLNLRDILRFRRKK